MVAYRRAPTRRVASGATTVLVLVAGAVVLHAGGAQAACPFSGHAAAAAALSPADHHRMLARGRGSAGTADGEYTINEMPCGDMFECKTIQALFAAHTQFTRQVSNTNTGYGASTSTGNATLAHLLQTHVASMEQRLDTNRPLNTQDPLFAKLFEVVAQGQIKPTFTNTSTGVDANEVGTTPCAIALTQAHAKVVSGFVTVGMPEMMKQHKVPAACSDLVGTQ